MIDGGTYRTPKGYRSRACNKYVCTLKGDCHRYTDTLCRIMHNTLPRTEAINIVRTRRQHCASRAYTTSWPYYIVMWHAVTHMCPCENTTSMAGSDINSKNGNGCDICCCVAKQYHQPSAQAVYAKGRRGACCVAKRTDICTIHVRLHILVDRTNKSIWLSCFSYPLSVSLPSAQLSLSG